MSNETQQTSVRVTLNNVPTFAFPLAAELVDSFGKGMTSTMMLTPKFCMNAHKTRSGNIIINYKGEVS